MKIASRPEHHVGKPPFKRAVTTGLAANVTKFSREWASDSAAAYFVRRVQARKDQAHGLVRVGIDVEADIAVRLSALRAGGSLRR